jgi:hypothetical protein
MQTTGGAVKHVHVKLPSGAESSYGMSVTGDCQNAAFWFNVATYKIRRLFGDLVVPLHEFVVQSVLNPK